MTSLKRLFVVMLMVVGAFGLVLNWTQIQILKFIALSGALHVAVGIIAEVMYGFFKPWSSDYRFAGTLHWNQQGYLCMMVVLASLCLLRERQQTWFYSALAAFGMLFLLLTRSRSTLIAVCLAGVLYFLVAASSRLRLLTLFLGGSMVLIMIMSGVGGQLLSLANRGGEGSENLTGRAPLWRELMTYVDHRPMLGYGFEGFWNDHTIDDVSDDQHWSIDAAHSGYMEAWLTIGLVGMILHTGTLLIGVMEGVRAFLRSRAIIFLFGGILCCIYLVGGILESVMIIKPSPISFYFTMLLAALAHPGPFREPTGKMMRPRRESWLPPSETRPFACNDHARK